MGANDMTSPKLAAIAAVFATLGAIAPTASAETRWERHHPRQDQVLDRAAREQHRITQERREGELTSAQAHRLRLADRQIVREDHRLARANGGYITPAEQRRLNRQENRLGHHIPG